MATGALVDQGVFEELARDYVPQLYLDSVTNKDSTLPPIPHLHSLLSDDVEPYPEVDIFRLIRTSYEEN
ncbi:hypothetical protein P7K49_006877 [Saguinus oedipus]|uniref:Uncharacterized protein n=1 Tax=Saguinus oedipus TaxID=9490 RepID=A0ABQ9W3N3_SAGOE|nr:hypothetical protein P7K49_006877 [Saguinus oedipus]